MSQALALETLIQALKQVGARYLIAGSVASSAQGIPRSTRDTDLLVQIGPLQAAPLARALGDDWYIDPEFAREAMGRGISFNIVHIPSGSKFDIFPAVEEFHYSELERAYDESVSLPGGSVQCLVATAEDMILAKLRWYRLGGCMSEQQWSDIAGMLATNPNLDFDYLNGWAVRMNVADLLNKAITEADEFF